MVVCKNVDIILTCSTLGVNNLHASYIGSFRNILKKYLWIRLTPQPVLSAEGEGEEVIFEYDKIYTDDRLTQKTCMFHRSFGKFKNYFR